MKKIMALALVLMGLLGLSGCSGQDKMEFMGLSSRLISVNPEEKTVVVEIQNTEKDGNDFKWSSLQGVPVTLDCTDVPVLYCDNETHEFKDISISDLVEGDELLLNIKREELEKAKEGPVHVKQIQLSTQRL